MLPRLQDAQTGRHRCGPRELRESLRLLKTDYFDLYQLHALTDVDEVEQAFGPGGADGDGSQGQGGWPRPLHRLLGASRGGRPRLGPFPFDSILFPLSFTTWFGAGFGPSVYKRARKAGMGVLALKAMAQQLWPKGKRRPWNKTFYQPFDDIDRAALGLRFTLYLPVDALIPPGHWELFRMALDLAQVGALVPLNRKERRLVRQIAVDSDPIFP